MASFIIFLRIFSINAKETRSGEEEEEKERLAEVLILWYCSV